MIDFDDPELEDAVFGRGKIEDFTWEGLPRLHHPAWLVMLVASGPNTGKPPSPKLVIMNLRDHLFARRPTSWATRKAR